MEERNFRFSGRREKRDSLIRLDGGQESVIPKLQCSTFLHFNRLEFRPPLSLFGDAAFFRRMCILEGEILHRISLILFPNNHYF